MLSTFLNLKKLRADAVNKLLKCLNILLLHQFGKECLMFQRRAIKFCCGLPKHFEELSETRGCFKRAAGNQEERESGDV